MAQDRQGEHDVVVSLTHDPSPRNRSPATAPKRRPAAETRHAIVEATAGLLCDRGAGGLTVHAIMERTGIARTTFYRQFSDPYDVVEQLIGQLVAHMAEQGGAWLREPSAVGSPDQIRPNLIRAATAVRPSARLLLALHHATGIDERLRRMWREQLVQPRIDAVATAIRRDQAAGVIDATLDADATALALSLMNEQLLLEMVCRDGASPEDYARVAGPIWEAALFGRPSQAIAP